MTETAEPHVDMLRIIVRRWEIPSACPPVVAAVLRPVVMAIEHALDAGVWTLRRATIGLPGADERYVPLGAVMEEDCRKAVQAAETGVRDALDKMESGWPNLVRQVEDVDPTAATNMPDPKAVRAAFSITVSLDEQCAVPVSALLAGAGTEVPI